MHEIIYLDGKKVRRGDFANLEKLKSKPLWIDITGITREEARRLTEVFDLHPITEEDISTYRTRIKVEEFPNYLVCIIYGITVRGIAPKESFELVDQDFVLGKNYLISNHPVTVPYVEELKKDDDRLLSLFANGVDHIFHRLVDAEIDNYFTVLEKMDDLIDHIEEEVTRNPNPAIMTEILGLKRLLAVVRKTVFHHRDNFSYLAHGYSQFISKKLEPYMRDVYDHSIRVSDQVDTYREAVINTFDVYMSAISHKLNEVMKTLSVIATIALPITMISSIYGTNFTNLPGSKAAVGFWVMVAAMITVVVTMLTYFRRRNWF